jgi:hypothetical protein
MSELQTFEFTQQHNEAIGTLARRMKLTALLSFAIGTVALLVVAASGGRISLVAPYVALLVALGVVTLKASASFRLIVTTQGSDITHLMRAIGYLRRGFLIQAVSTLAAFVLIAGALLWLFSTLPQVQRITSGQAGSELPRGTDPYLTKPTPLSP